MAPVIHTKEWYRDSKFSDITIEYSGRQFPAHRIILSNQSEYFRTMLDFEDGRGGFAERTQDVVELKGDDPDALEAVLRFIYTGDYIERGSELHHWYFYLRVAETANKYLITVLEKDALAKLWNLIEDEEDIGKINAIIDTLPKITYRSDLMKDMADDLVEEYFEELIKLPAYREVLKSDSDRMLHHLDRLAFATKLKERNLTRCHTCGRYEVTVEEEGSCNSCGEVRLDVMECWIKGGDI